MKPFSEYNTSTTPRHRPSRQRQRRSSSPPSEAQAIHIHTTTRSSSSNNNTTISSTDHAAFKPTHHSSHTPRELRATRELQSLRGVRRKLRTYPELSRRAESPTYHPQKLKPVRSPNDTTATIPRMPSVSHDAKLRPQSPILQALQSDREKEGGGDFSQTPLCDGKEMHVLRTSSGEKDLVEAMQDLTVFGSLTPLPGVSPQRRSGGSAVAAFDDLRAEAEVPGERGCAGMLRGEEDFDAWKDSSQESRGAVSGADCSGGLGEEDTDAHSVASSASKISQNEGPGEIVSMAQDADPELAPRTDRSQFDDLLLGSVSAPPDNPALPPLASANADEDFEVIETLSRFQTQRNGRPGVWGRWVKGQRR